MLTSAEEELLKLQELIEQKQNEIDAFESKVDNQYDSIYVPEAYETSIQSWSKEQTLKDPTHQDNIYELNQLLEDYNEKQMDYYTRNMQNGEPILNQPPITPIDTPVDEPNPESIQPNFTPQDLIDQNRHLFPDYSDEQILNALSVIARDQVEAAFAGRDDTIFSYKSPEAPVEDEWSPTWGDGMGLDLLENMYHQQMKSLWYDIPASNLAMLSSKDIPEEDLYNTYVEIMSATPGKENHTKEDWDAEFTDFKNKGMRGDLLAADLFKQGQDYMQKFYEDNPEVQATIEWFGNNEDIITKDGKFVFDKWLYNMLVNVAPSIMGSQASGQLGAWAGQFVGTAAGAGVALATFGLDPSDPAMVAAMRKAGEKIGEKWGRFIGQGLYGLEMEGSAYMANAVNTLVTSQVIDEEKFARILEEKRKQFGEVSKNPTEMHEMLTNYVQNNYEMVDGQLVTIPMNVLDAIESVKAGTALYAGGASVIEMADVFARYYKLPESITNSLKNKYFTKIVDYTSDHIRTIDSMIPKIKVNIGDSKAVAFGKNIFDNTFWRGGGSTAVQGMEELFQEHLSLATDIHGLGLSFGRDRRDGVDRTAGIGPRPEWKWEPGINWREKWSWKNSVIEPIVGGMIGGRFSNNMATTFDLLQLKNRQYNKSLDYQFKQSLSDGVVVREEGPSTYKLYYANSVMNEKDGSVEVREKNLSPLQLKDDDGNTAPDEFATFDEAKTQADIYNVKFTNGMYKRIAASNKFLYKSEAKTEANEDGTYSVNVYNQDGNFLGQYGKYKVPYKANRKTTSLNKNIKNINKTIDKYGIDEISKIESRLKKSYENIEKENSKNEAIIDENGVGYQQAVVEDAKDFKNMNETTQTDLINKGELFDRPTGKMLIRGFMLGHVTNKETDSRVELTDKEKPVVNSLSKQGALVDAEVISNTLRAYPDILKEENIDIDSFLQEFKNLENSDIYLEDLQNVISVDGNAVDETVPDNVVVENVLKKFEEFAEDFDDIESETAFEDAAYQASDIFEDRVLEEEVATKVDATTLLEDIKTEEKVEEPVVEEKAPEVAEEMPTETKALLEDTMEANRLGLTQEETKEYVEKRKQERKKAPEITKEETKVEAESKPFTIDTKDKEVKADDTTVERYGEFVKAKTEIAKQAALDKKAPEVKVETVKEYDSKLLKDNPDKVYLFGDNLVGKGKGGQAVIRNEPNAIGIPTKKKPSMTEDSFMRDYPPSEYDSNVKAIDKAFEKVYEAIDEGKTIVLPENNLGSGFAKLQEKAPKTWAYLQDKIAELKEGKKAPEIIEDKKAKFDNILTAREQPIIPTKGQEKALKIADKFLEDPKKTIGKVSIPMVLAGFAGTGKTTILENVIRTAKNKNYENVHVVAPTGKAVARLGEAMPKNTGAEFSTLHSLMYGEPNEQGQWVSQVSLDNESLVIIDESSMIDEGLYNDIKKHLIEKGAKVIFVGDSFQLEPIGKDPELLKTASIELTEIKRQKGGQILDFATSLRTLQRPFIPSVSKGNVKVSDNIEGFFYDSVAKNEDSVIIVYKNDQRVYYNIQGRARKFKLPDEAQNVNYYQDKKDELLLPGEKVIAISNSEMKMNGESFELNNPKIKKKVNIVSENVFKTDEYGVPLKSTSNGFIAEDIDADGRKKEYLFLPTYGAASLNHNTINIKDNPWMPNNWVGKKGRFDKKSADIITYGYSITAHKSQGSEWDKVFVIPDPPFRYPTLNPRWLYTAITRAKNNLVLQRIPDYATYKSPEGQMPIPKASWPQIANTAKKSYEESKDKKYKLRELKPEIQSPANQAKAKKFTRMMFEKFEGKIPYKFINDPELLNEYGMLVQAYYDTKEKKVVINLPLADPDAGIHEFLHPFTTEMRLNNPILFEKLLEDIVNTKPGRRALLDTASLYSDKQEEASIMSELSYLLDKNNGDIENIKPKVLHNMLKEFDDSDFTVSEELLTSIMQQEAYKQYNSVRGIINRFFNWIRSKLFGPTWRVNVYARALDGNTSIVDIARLIANSERKFSLETVDRKLTGQHYDFKPTNRFQFLAKVEKKVELDVEDKGRNVAWLHNFYDETFDMAKDLESWGWGEKVRIYKEDFASAMLDVLPLEVHGSFSSWYRRKFKEKKLPGDNITFVGKESIYDLALEQYESNKEILDEIAFEGTQDEREISNTSLLFMRDFGTTLTSNQLNLMINKANSPGMRNYEEWKDFVFNTVLDFHSKKLASWKNEGLHKFYNQLVNTVRTNAGKSNSQIINYEMLIVNNPDRTTSYKLAVKGPEKKWRNRKMNTKTGQYDYTDKKANKGYQKKTLFDSAYENLKHFKWLSGADIKRMRVKVDPEAPPGEEVISENISSLYGFLNADELIDFDKHLIEKEGLTIAFSRGDSDKLALVSIKEWMDAAKNKKSIQEYLRKQVNNYLTLPQAKRMLKDMLSKNIKERAAIIAGHEAMKSVWPKYAFDEKGGPNVYKRFKIPFTPITMSNEMEDFRVIKFEPKKVKFVYGDKEFSPMQIVEGKQKDYIGDGESITSTKGFLKFNKGHGLKKGTAIAKTVHYLKDGDDTYALKHLHIQAEPGWKIIDSRSKKNLFKITENGNIYLGSAHPLYKEGEDNYVDQLVTKYEAKIGSEIKKENKYGVEGIFEKNNNELIVPGKSIGFIKYEERMEKHAKHGMQWYNHLTDPELIKYFDDLYLPKVEDLLRSAIRVAIDTNKSTSADKISKLLEVIQTDTDIGRVPTLLELARLGAGSHRATGELVDKIIQSNLIKPALQLDKKSGSTYNIAMDVTGALTPGEISISRKNAGYIINKYMIAQNITSVKDVETSEINEWLASEKVYGMVTRFPVPHEGGVFMARIKSLHERDAVAMMNINDVKNRLEGDNDGDHIIVEFLPSDEMTMAFKKHLDKIKITTQDLNKFVVPEEADMFSQEGKAGLISNMTFGKRAIGEIANIQAAYGVMRNLYNSFENKETGQTIYLRDPNERVTLSHVYYNDKMGWTGTVSDALRLYLQAAVDNAKFGLLGQWQYDRSQLMSLLFKYKNKTAVIPGGDAFDSIVTPMIDLHLMPNRIRNGYEYEIGRYTFANTLEKSKEYGAYTFDRVNYLANKYNIKPEIKEGWESKLTPIESIAAAPNNILNEMSSQSKYNLFGYEVSPFVISMEMQRNSHGQAIERLNRKHMSRFLENALKKDGKEGNLEYANKHINIGKNYANDMGSNLQDLIEMYKELGPQSMDYNDKFISFKELWDEVFNKNLSETAKVAATHHFLQGFERTIIDKEIGKKSVITSSIAALHLPPVSDNPGQVSLLDSNVMKKYFNLFNKEVKQSKNLGALETFDKEHLETIAERIC